MILTIWFVTGVLVFVSYLKDRGRTEKALTQGLKSLGNFSPGVLGMVATVGLMLALIPKETMVVMFTYKGIMGFVLVSFFGAMVTIPGPIAFPLAGSLVKLGVSYSTIASFITTLTMVGMVTAPLEISYFGKRFTVVRQVLSFFAAIAIGLIMGIFI